jgi:peroxiredoxin
LQLELARIKDLGASVAAVSPETPETLLSTIEKHNLTLELLSDRGNNVARQYGLAFTVPPELRPVYESFKIDIPAANGDDTYGLPIPATYIIDWDRKIRTAFLDADYTKRLDPEAIIEALKQVQR